MAELLYYAIPAFVVLLVAEAISYRVAHDDDDGLIGYESVDTATSLTMGLGNVTISFFWRAVVVVTYAAIYELTPLRMPENAWWAFVVLFFAEDLCYYTFHRVSHRVRLFWAGHVVHHSSRFFNFSTALRQKWTPMLAWPFWVPLAVLGFKPWMILLQQAISLIYQFWIHTERIGRLPTPIEFAFNTPSHHRVHHGANPQYLDRNYAGILIIWDRLFGSFQPERERVVYGLTKNIQTHNPLKVAFHEFAAMAHDVRGARTWRERLGYVFGGPGWSPDGHDWRFDQPVVALADEPSAVSR